jgi:hypothetical protein
MNAEQDNFEQLRRLLALKRHETPPPGYFDRFSAQVTARIRAGEGAVETGWLTPLGWFQRLWELFERKPVLAGAFGAAVSAMVVWGAVTTEVIDANSQALAENMPGQMSIGSRRMNSTPPLLGQASIVSFPSTNGIITSQPSALLFDDIKFVSLRVPGN